MDTERTIYVTLMKDDITLIYSCAILNFGTTNHALVPLVLFFNYNTNMFKTCII